MTIPDGGLYQCSGLAVRSSFSLSAPSLEEAEAKGNIDLYVSVGEKREQPYQRPTEDVVAELMVDGVARYTICRTATGYTARVFGIADFDISESLATVSCHEVPGGKFKFAPIIIPGTITAFILAMRGECVLHASAVDFGGRAVAFVGQSGQGKSTMAALFCSEGGLLVTDDVLPIEVEDSPEGKIVMARRSGREIRLREKSASLAERLPVGARITADDRSAVAPESTPVKRIQVARIVIPAPDRTIGNVVAKKLTAGQATLALARFHRIEGWRDEAALRKQFDDVSAVAEIVPVYEARVPWGPPFLDEIPKQLLNAIDW